MRINQSLPVLLATLALAACAAPTPPDYAAQYQPLVDTFVAGWNEGNVEALDAVLADDFQRLAPAGMTANGPEAHKEVVRAHRMAYPDTLVVVTESHYLADRSFHLWTFTGTHTGPGEMDPTGQAVETSGFTRFRYADGKIVEELVAFDALDWMTQLGYSLAPPAAAAAE